METLERSLLLVVRALRFVAQAVAVFVATGVVGLLALFLPLGLVFVGLSVLVALLPGGFPTFVRLMWGLFLVLLVLHLSLLLWCWVRDRRPQ